MPFVKVRVEDEGGRRGWLGAPQDPNIGLALQAIQRKIELVWTVAWLAHKVGMSRSGFAARYKAFVGETPMHYVARWKMNLAASWLREDQCSLGEGKRSKHLDYQPGAAFSRAF